MRSIIRQAQVAAGVINCTTRACATQTRVKRIEGKTDLKEILSDLIPQEVQRVKNFRKAHDKTVVGTTSVEMMYGGMRGIKGLVYETSLLDADEGIRFRGFSIPECQKMLPKAPGGNEPLPEGLFFLLLTGAVPTEEQVAWVTREWHRRASIPTHVTSMLSTLPTDLHPMVQLVMASAALQSESKFAQAYAAGTPKSRYWEYAYEDAMDLIAKLPTVAAMIYKNVYRGHESVAPLKADLDWSGNFAQMLGFKDPAFAELMRLYLTIHADHEGGNVSAHTIHLVGSALSDPYLSYSAGMCGLAGPLHGLANQEVLVWLTKLVKEIGIAPTDDALRNYVETTMKKGQVVPGFGHAVLRKTDPRYTCQQEFANKHLPDDPLFKLVKQVFKVVPPVLSKTGKIKNPWPNVDAHSGVLLQYYGLKEMSYYTVLFGVSRALGTVAQYVWSRAFGYPIERPKSLSTDALTQLVKSARPTEEMNE